MKTSGLEKSIQFFRLWEQKSNFKNAATIIPYNGSFMVMFHSEDEDGKGMEKFFSSLTGALSYCLENGYVFTPASVFINPNKKD